MRNLDTPVEDGLQELAGEIVSKRLGLSATVASQIARYRETADRDGHVAEEEAVAVFRLVGRRADATLVYADAGRRAARYAARRGSAFVRGVLRVTPRGIRRRFGLRAAARAASHVLRADLLPRGGVPEVELRDSLATRGNSEGTGCYFYSAAFAELLRVLSGFEGAMVHESCRHQGAECCRWRAATAEGYE